MRQVPLVGLGEICHASAFSFRPFCFLAAKPHSVMRLVLRILRFEVAAWLGRPRTAILQPMIIRLLKIGSLLAGFIGAIASVPAITEAQSATPVIVKAGHLT